jgi:hypothetical protein
MVNSAETGLFAIAAAMSGFVRLLRGVRDLTGLASRRRAPRATKRAVPTSAQTFSDFERSAVQSDARPFNTGRTLIDARTAETWRSSR